MEYFELLRRNIMTTDHMNRFYRVNPKNGVGSHKRINSNSPYLKMFTEVDDEGYLCTKTMLYFRNCYLSGATPDEEKVKVLEKEDEVIKNNIIKGYMNLPSISVGEDFED